MPRSTERKTAPSFENLETRNLQSALSIVANVAAVSSVAPTSAVIPLYKIQDETGSKVTTS